MVRSVPVPSSSVNLRSFLIFGTASQARTFTARKSLLRRCQIHIFFKQRLYLHIGKVDRLVLDLKLNCALGAADNGSLLGLFSALEGPNGFIVGKSKQSRMLAVSVANITRRSTPMPKPPVGGMPYSKAHRKSSSTSQASSSPAALKGGLGLKAGALIYGIVQLAEGIGVLSAPRYSSKRSVYASLPGMRFARGISPPGVR